MNLSSITNWGDFNIVKTKEGMRLVQNTESTYRFATYVKVLLKIKGIVYTIFSNNYHELLYSTGFPFLVEKEQYTIEPLQQVNKICQDINKSFMLTKTLLTINSIEIPIDQFQIDELSCNTKTYCAMPNLVISCIQVKCESNILEIPQITSLMDNTKILILKDIRQPISLDFISHYFLLKFK